MDEERAKSSPRLTEAKHTTKGLLKNANAVVAPIVINHLMPTVKQTFDLTIRGVPNSLFSGKGDAITQSRGPLIFILYNDERSTVRKRFSVAHELGHLYLGHLHGNSSGDLNTENFDELEANTFAAHLLMPLPLLRKDIKNGIKNVDKLSAKYQVSNEAMWWQINKAGLLNLL